jgi:predicted ATPase/DNA-binding SARP family transcriptional activator
MLVRLLGPFEVEGDDGPVLLAGSSQRAVLALLALRAGRPVGVTELTDAVWPDEPPPSARNTLQSHVARLRARLGVTGLITHEPAGYCLHLPRESVDALRLEMLLGERAGEAVRLWRGSPLPEFPHEPFRGIAVRLTALYRNALVQHAGTRTRQAAADLLREHVATDPCWESGVLALAEALAASGCRTEALDTLRRHADAMVERLGLDPSAQVREVQQRLLKGDKYEMYGRGSASATRAPGEQAQGEQAPGEWAPGERAPGERAPGGQAPGERVLGGQASAGRVVTGPTPGGRLPPGGLATDGRVPGGQVPSGRVLREQGLWDRVPLRFSSFLGRESERRQLARLLAEPGLITVVGPGGVGKTRLVAETVRSESILAETLRADSSRADSLRAETLRAETLQADSPRADTLGAGPLRADSIWDGQGGVAWIDAAEVREPDFLAAVAVGVGARMTPHDDPLTVIAEAALRHPVIVLDNCEHVLEAAARLAGALRGVRTVVTSQETLRVDGERIFRLGPLETSAAIRLFRERARLQTEPQIELQAEPQRELQAEPQRELQAEPQIELQAEPQTELQAGPRTEPQTGPQSRPQTEPHSSENAKIQEIVERLDLLPLAIELAAVQAAALGVDELAARLDDRLDLLDRGNRAADPRHRTLRAVVEWSFGLLDQPSGKLLRRLAVFAGGFTVEAAESVAADEWLPRTRIAGLLAGLVDRSLVVRHTSHRFRLLETVRAYALEQAMAGFEAGGGRHAAAELIATAQRRTASPEQQQAVQRGLQAVEGAQQVVQNGQQVVQIGQRAKRRSARQRDQNPIETGQPVESELAEAERRHAAAMAAAAEELGARMRGADQEATVREIDALLPDLRLAWSRGDVSIRIRLAAAMYRYGYRCQQYEVLAWGRAAAGADRTALPPAVIADALAAAATHAWGRGDLTEARALAGRADPPGAAAHEVLGDVALVACDAETALVHYRAMTGDPVARVSGLVGEALVLAWSGHGDEAVATAATAVELADGAGNPGARAEARYALGEALGDRDPERALALLAEAGELAGRVDDRLFQAASGTAAVAIRSRHGDPAVALAAFRDVLGLWRRAGNDTLQAAALRNLVVLLARVGADETAVLLDAALPEALVYPAEAARLDRARDAARERLGPDRFAEVRGRGARLGTARAAEEAAVAIEVALGAPAEETVTKGRG